TSCCSTTTTAYDLVQTCALPIYTRAAYEGPRSAADEQSFTYIKSRLGVIGCQSLQLGSPFDYSKQATLFLETDLPEPNDTLRFLDRKSVGKGTGLRQRAGARGRQ